MERLQPGEEKGGEGQRQKGEGGAERSGVRVTSALAPLAHSSCCCALDRRVPVPPWPGTQPPQCPGRECSGAAVCPQPRPQRHGRYLAGRRLPEGRSLAASGSGARRSCRPAGHLRQRAGGYLEPAESTAPQSPDQLCRGTQAETSHARRLLGPPAPQISVELVRPAQVTVPKGQLCPRAGLRPKHTQQPLLTPSSALRTLSEHQRPSPKTQRTSREPSTAATASSGPQWCMQPSHRIIAALRVEKTSKIIKPNRQPNTTMPAKPCPQMPHLPVF